MPRIRLAPLCALLLAVLAAPLLAGETAAPAAPKVDFEQYTLPNGLRVILHVDRKLPIVNVNQWFHVARRTRSRGAPGSPTSSST